MQTIRWSEIGGAGGCRAVISLLRGPHAFPIHRHDFPEVFWVTKGSGVHRINGDERPLHAGVLVLIRPQDAHGFRSDARGMLVQNVAIHPGVAGFVRKRHFLNDDSFWSGKAAPIPRHYEMGVDQLGQLKVAFEELSLGPADIFHAERFLLNLLHLVHVAPRLAEVQPVAGCLGLPDWLAQALIRWRGDAKHFSEGTPALARLAGRSPEHVARVFRECAGRTPTDWLNEMRMTHAAKQLEVTNRKILDIAMECGFASLGHFYAVFQRAHGCAPRAYRMRFLPRPI